MGLTSHAHWERLTMPEVVCSSGGMHMSRKRPAMSSAQQHGQGEDHALSRTSTTLAVFTRVPPLGSGPSSRR